MEPMEAVVATWWCSNCKVTVEPETTIAYDYARDGWVVKQTTEETHPDFGEALVRRETDFIPD